MQNHEAERAQDRRAELSALAASFSEHMSDEAAQGKQHLMSAKEFYSAEEQLHDQGALPVSNLAR